MGHSPVSLQLEPATLHTALAAALLARPLLQTLPSLDLIMFDPAAAAVDLLMLLACFNGGGFTATTAAAEAIPDCSISCCCRFAL